MSSPLNVLRNLTAVALVCIPAAAFAHTKEDEAACRPDVFRLCKAQIPNQARIVACLHSNKSNLSQACFNVFNRDTPAATRAAAPVPVQAQPMQWGAR